MRPFDQAQLVAVHAGGVLAHQQHGVGVEHRHDHHRAVAAAVQALVVAALAVGELQVEALEPVRAGVVLGDAVDDGQARLMRAPWRRSPALRACADGIMAGCTRRTHDGGMLAEPSAR